eukprot:261228_1
MGEVVITLIFISVLFISTSISGIGDRCFGNSGDDACQSTQHTCCGYEGNKYGTCRRICRPNSGAHAESGLIFDDTDMNDFVWKALCAMMFVVCITTGLITYYCLKTHRPHSSLEKEQELIEA